jgi:thiamine biosynthesis lipoprotein
MAMGTVITVQVLGHATSQRARRERKQHVDRALAWFTHIEQTCSRFDATSELRRLCARVGEAVPVSAALFQSVLFARVVAERTGGAFDPTIGVRMESRGYTKEHRTGASSPSGLDATPASYRDIEIDGDAQTITLHAPMVLDLGAVAKGLAIDAAATELESLGNVAIDAGGDLFLLGTRADGAPWRVGLRHPHEAGATIETIDVADAAVCTSGSYERGAHILDGRDDATDVNQIASATVMGPSAMVADAMATAAYVLGPVDGVALLEQEALAGVLYSSSLERFTTSTWPA